MNFRFGDALLLEVGGADADAGIFQTQLRSKFMRDFCKVYAHA